MKKNIFTILCSIALTAVIVGCSNDDITVTPTELDRTMINFEATGGSGNFAITTPSAWTISAGGVDWLTIDPTSGVGNATVTVTAANLAITQSRSVTLTISAENAPAETILVFQNGTSVPADAGTIQGDDINYCPVETVTLTTEILGATSYQWYMNGNAIAGATTNTYIVTQSGIYNVAGVNATGVGAQSPNKTVTIEECILPDDAGTIQGLDENTCPARIVTLTIAEIAYAETYNWYRNGTIISGATTTTYIVTQSGTYTVAGFNATGEGALSPEKEVTINDCGDMPDDLFDGAEDHPVFTINSPGDLGWTYIDGDGSPTYGFDGLDFPGTEAEMAYIVFDPTLTTPTPVGNCAPNTGDMFFACFASALAVNDDWMISPEVAFSGPAKISFWGRTYNATYGAERFRIVYSTTGTAKADFTNVVTPGSYVEVPSEWTQFTYDLPVDAKYVAIHCVSDDAFVFMVDDIFIGQGPIPTRPAPVSPVGTEKVYERAKRK